MSLLAVMSRKAQFVSAFGIVEPRLFHRVAGVDQVDEVHPP